jgi:beta-galactosidase
MAFKKKISVIGILCLMASSLYAGQDVRFSDGWKFYLGDASGAQQTSFSDASWTNVYLPHTPRIELNYATSSIYMGVCWYRKSFTPAPSFQGKKIYIEFGGAMQTAQVYLNGSLLAAHLGGYTPFVLDISKSLNFGASNVLAVRLDNNPSASFPPGNSNPDFLYFGGLYRDVYLHVLDSLHISNALLANIPGSGGIFVTYSSVSTASATVQVATHVMNEYAAAKSCMVTTTLLDSNGTSVASNSSTEQNLAAGAASTFTQSLAVSGPHLWSPNTPYLYKLKSQVLSGSTLVDTCTTTIGIRTIAFTHSGGFQINGQRIIGRGANRHQAYPYLGNAAPISAQLRDALRMKQYGFNFVRMCHYVQSQGFVDACDKYGVLGMACLPGWQYNAGTTDFTNNCEAALRAMVRCYRNHPSVVVYETSLNEATYTDAWATQMNTAAHQEYPGNQMFTTGWQTTQFDVYCAASQGGVRSTTDSRPIIICEYGDWDLGCVYGTSITGCADRIVRSDGEAALLRQATNHASQLSLNRALSWLSADALWSAFDYQSWSLAPYTTSGSLDIFRIPKYSAWFYKSQRSPADTLEPGPAKGGPMVFIASSWTSSSAIPVKVYSNCDQVSLYLNNTLVSTQSPTTGTNLEHPPFSFSIPSFQSGTLRADGLIGGAVKATYSVTTPGTASKVSVAIDTASTQFSADGSDIALVYASILDANGTVLPAASNSITFAVSSGPGDLVGTNPVAAQAGIATIMLRSRTTGGAITITAAASGLTTSTATVTSTVSPTTGVIDLFGARSIARNSGFSMSRIGSILRVKLPRAESAGHPALNLTLYNAQGKLVGFWTLTKRDNIVPVGTLSRGVYFGRIDNGPLVFVKE